MSKKPLTPPKKAARCEACGHAGAKPSVQRVFDAKLPPPGHRARMLCTDPVACVKRMHEFFATLGNLRWDKVERRMHYELTEEGEAKLAWWKARCYRVPPPIDFCP